MATMNDLVEQIAMKVQAGLLDGQVAQQQLAALADDDGNIGQILLNAGTLIVTLRSKASEVNNLLIARNNLIADLQSQLQSQPA